MPDLVEAVKEKVFLTTNDVNLRIHDSVVKFKQQFYYCTGVPDDTPENALRIKLASLDGKQKSFLTDPNNSDIDFMSPELGYMNWNAEALYISRVPYRRQKQGIGVDNLVYHRDCSNNYDRVTRSMIQTTQFLEMLDNKYTKFDQIFHLAYFETQAFSRDFCVLNEKDKQFILYRNERCGTVLKDQKVLLFPVYDNSLFRSKLEQLGVYLAE